MLTFTLTDLAVQADRLTAQITLLQQQRDALLITEQLLRNGTVDTADTPPSPTHTPDPVQYTTFPLLQ